MKRITRQGTSLKGEEGPKTPRRADEVCEAGPQEMSHGLATGVLLAVPAEQVGVNTPKERLLSILIH